MALPSHPVPQLVRRLNTGNMLVAALQAGQEFVSSRTSQHGAPWKGLLQEATCISKQGLALLLLLEVKC